MVVLLVALPNLIRLELENWCSDAWLRSLGSRECIDGRGIQHCKLASVVVMDRKVYYIALFVYYAHARMLEVELCAMNVQ